MIISQEINNSFVSANIDIKFLGCEHWDRKTKIASNFFFMGKSLKLD